MKTQIALIITLLTACTWAQTVPIYPNAQGQVNYLIWTSASNPLLNFPTSPYTITARPAINAWRVTGKYVGPVALTLYAGGQARTYVITDDLCYSCDVTGDGEVNLEDFEMLTACWLWKDVL